MRRRIRRSCVKSPKVGATIVQGARDCTMGARMRKTIVFSLHFILVRLSLRQLQSPYDVQERRLPPITTSSRSVSILYLFLSFISCH